MHRVVEISVIRSLVDLHPLNRFTGLPRIPHELKFWIFALDLRMAIHTDLSCRDVGIGRGLDIRMAIAAVHPQLPSVNLVREGDGLSRFVPDTRVLRGEVIPNP
jgi:hypothetical protein